MRYNPETGEYEKYYRLKESAGLTEDDKASPFGNTDIMDHAGDSNRLANFSVGEICHVFIMLINV